MLREQVTYAYAAGLIDGEGSIMLIRERAKTSRVVVVSMTSTSPELTDYMFRNFGGQVRYRPSRKRGHSASWVWSVRNRKAVDFLVLVVDHLVERKKSDRAQLILADYVAVTPRNGKYTSEMAARKRVFEERFLSI